MRESRAGLRHSYALCSVQHFNGRRCARSSLDKHHTLDKQEPLSSYKSRSQLTMKHNSPQIVPLRAVCIKVLQPFWQSSNVGRGAYDATGVLGPNFSAIDQGPLFPVSFSS